MEFYNTEKDKILQHYNVNKDIGIKESNLEKLYEKYGKNTLEVGKDLSFINLYFLQIKSFLNLLLLFLVCFAFIVWYNTKNFEYLIDSIIIFIIFLINTLIGAYQNYNSRKIAKTLTKMLNSKITVLRDGKEFEIDSTELTCGDIVLLKSGDKVPADCYIINSNNLKVDESILTGESLYVNKKEGTIKNKVEMHEMSNMLFMNTFIASGNTKAIVVKIGSQTQIGQIAKELKIEKKKISFLDEIDEASKTISKFAILLISIVSIVLILKGFDIIEVFLIASALIIGSVPEGLPVIVVFLLSSSIHSLAKKNILVKDMGLLETLGSINILCTDKTGTLTTNKMYVKKIYTDFKTSNTIAQINKFNLDKLSKVIVLANETQDINNDTDSEPEDLALLNIIKEQYNITEIKKENKVNKFEPFSSETRYCSAQSNNITYKKGAFETIFNNCNYIIKNSKIEKITQKDKEIIIQTAKKYTDEALRLIAFSYETNEQVIFIGFTGLYDKPKEGVRNTIKELYNSGIDVKMITGDNLNTAIAIAKECGFKDPKGVEFKDIKDLPPIEFKKKVLECNVFGRVMPKFKEKIVEILQEEGNRVAITGDGVNDTIALRNADVGIVMGAGSDIAKESADMILINNDFNETTIAIREGRGIFTNIRKVINYLLTANLAEVMVVFIASFLGIIPFTAIQILWVNFVTDVFPALSLGLDKFSKNIMKEKPTGKNEKILNNRIKLLTLFISIKKVILIFIIYYVGYYYSDKNIIFAQTLTFTWLVLTHFVRIAAIRFDEKVSLFTNKFVIGSIMLVLIMQLILIYTPLRVFFDLVEIPLIYWAILALTVVVGTIFAKLIANLVNYIVKKWQLE